MTLDLQEAINEKIRLVDDALDRALNLDIQKKLYDAIRHLPLAGGKRLRPVLAMIVADAISGSGLRTIPFGIALEITHNFTLIHDDIMDKDDFRRNVITVHKAFDEATAINAGDVLFARAFEVLTQLDCDDRIFREIVADLALTVRKIGEGQQLDMDFENRTDVSENDCLQMIRLKTAILFETACRGAALIAGGTDEQIEGMRQYGLNIGMSFQIYDDLLDIIGNERKMGKPRLSDLRQGKRTIIVVHAFKHAKGDDLECLREILGNRNASSEDLERVVAVLDRVGSLNYARQLTQRYAEEAKTYLDCLPRSNDKERLEAIADYMISREL